MEAHGPIKPMKENHEIQWRRPWKPVTKANNVLIIHPPQRDAFRRGGIVRGANLLGDLPVAFSSRSAAFSSTNKLETSINSKWGWLIV